MYMYMFMYMHGIRCRFAVFFATSIDLPLSRVLDAFMHLVLYGSAYACCWVWLGSDLLRGEDKDLDEGVRDTPTIELIPRSGSWAHHDSVLDADNPASWYLRALYFVVQSLFTVGFGDISPRRDVELAFCLPLIVHGAFYFAYVIAAITSLLASRNIATRLYGGEQDSLRRYLVARRTPDDLGKSSGFFLHH